MTFTQVQEFFANLKHYVDARTRGDYDVSRIFNERLIKFLEADLSTATTEKREENPWCNLAELVIVAVAGGDMVRKVNEFGKALHEHWKEVKGTTDGDKLPMINFMREKSKQLGLPDPGAVGTRKMLEDAGCYNGGVVDPRFLRSVDDNDGGPEFSDGPEF